MEKTQLLALIREKLQDGTIAPDDLRQVQVLSEQADPGASRITNVLYIIGAIIAVIGAIILVAQNWSDIGFIGRALVTAGVAVTAYVSALFMKRPDQRVLSQVMFTISAVLAPIGIYVFAREFGVTFGPWLNTNMGLAMALAFTYAFWQTRRNILVVFITAFASWSYFASIAALFDVTSSVGKWTTIVAGISYAFVARQYHVSRQPVTQSEQKEKNAVEGLLYAGATAATIIPVMAFGDIGDLVAVALIFAAFYVSVHVKSRAMLLLAALFLIIHLIKLTAKYFGDSVSWPLALMLIGFLVIGIGYGVVYLSKKYLSDNAGV